MSDERAIEAVTRTLSSLVHAGVRKVEPGAGVETRPLNELANGTQDTLVNLFLYQADVDASLRNADAPGLAPGETGTPPLPLVLRYLLTPYVRDGDDLDAHRLLGGAIRILHDYPELDPAELAEFAPFSNVAQQLERIRITWQPFGEKDIYSLWSVFQTPYRMSVAFEVRAVLIDSARPPRTPVPVIRRGRRDEGPVARGDIVSPFPELTAAVPGNAQPAARSGERVVLRGSGLAAPSAEVRLTHPLLAAPVVVGVAAPDIAADEVAFTLTGPPDRFPAGLWSVALALTGTVTEDGEARQVTTLTNETPLRIAPVITAMTPTVTPEPGGTVTLRVDLAHTPAALPGQPVLMLLDGRAAPPGETGAFTFPGTAPGRHLVRLRVAGVDSLLIDRSGDRPAFDPSQSVLVEEA